MWFQSARTVLRQWGERLFKGNTRTIRTSASRSFRRRIPVLEVLEDRIAPATYNWNNVAGGNWDTVGNWTVGGVVATQLPGSGDDVLIPSLNTGAAVTHSQNVSDTVKSITASAPITLSGGTLSVAGAFGDSSAVTLSGGTLANATLTTGTTLQAPSGTSTLTGVTLSSGSTLSVADTVDISGGLTLSSGSTLSVTGTVYVSGGLIDNGTIALPGHNLDLVFNGTQTLTGNGSVLFGSSNSEMYLGQANTRLTIDSGITIHGASGVIGASGSVGGTTVINDGTIDADANGGGININPATFTNNATVETSNSGNVNINAGTWTNSGAITVNSGALSIYGGTWTNSGTITVSNGTLSINGGSWTNSGTITLTSGTLSLGGSWSNFGGGAPIIPGNIQVTGGTLNLGGQFRTADIGTLTNSGGIVTITGALDNSGATLALDDTTGSWYMADGSVTGGTLQTSGAAQFLQPLSSFTLANVAAFDGTWTMLGGNGGTTLVVRGDLNLNGAIDLSSNAALMFAGAAGTTQNINSVGTAVISMGVRAATQRLLLNPPTPAPVPQPGRW